MTKQPVAEHSAARTNNSSRTPPDLLTIKVLRVCAVRQDVLESKNAVPLPCEMSLFDSRPENKNDTLTDWPQSTRSPCACFRCCCLLFDWVAQPCIGLCSDASLQEKLRNSSFPTLFCQSFPYRSACIRVRACALDIDHPCGSAPRSFRNCASSRNPNDLLLF